MIVKAVSKTSRFFKLTTAKVTMSIKSLEYHDISDGKSCASKKRRQTS